MHVVGFKHNTDYNVFLISDRCQIKVLHIRKKDKDLKGL